jgi:outer membrane immunogenic protein
MLGIRSIGASALTLLTLTAAAAAADVARIPPAPPPPLQPAPVVVAPNSWTGLYAGLLGGYGWGSGSVANRGWIGGAYLGYNAAIDNNIVVGIEGDGSLTNKNGSNGGTTVSNPWDATLRARIGYGNRSWLLYGTGGLAFGSVKASTAGITESDTKTGWTAGVGAEAFLTNKVTGRIEYRYTNLGTASFTSSPSISYTSNDLLAGVGVKF